MFAFSRSNLNKPAGNNPKQENVEVEGDTDHKHRFSIAMVFTSAAVVLAIIAGTAIWTGDGANMAVHRSRVSPSTIGAVEQPSQVETLSLRKTLSEIKDEALPMPLIDEEEAILDELFPEDYQYVGSSLMKGSKEGAKAATTTVAYESAVAYESSRFLKGKGTSKGKSKGKETSKGKSKGKGAEKESRRLEKGKSKGKGTSKETGKGTSKETSKGKSKGKGKGGLKRRLDKVPLN